ncbi:MAG TPA: ATP-binding protein [Candidatus Saccharimonadales bacterium]|nr:ATP-binding protein [Candidatus Saccharimonadales bacterium]
MELPHQTQRSSSTALLLVTIIVVGVFTLSSLNVQTVQEQTRRNVEERVATIAAALDTEAIANSQGMPTDADAPAYRSLKSRLIALKQTSGDIRSIALFVAKDDAVVTLVDSQQPGGSGTTYTDTPALKNIFYSAPIPVVEGPISNQSDSWVTALAPIFNPKTGRVLAVVQMQLDAAQYNQTVVSALYIPLGVGVLLLVAVIVYEISRRRDARLARMRSELVSIASHELRSPLTGMRWAVEGLRKSVTNKAEDVKLKAMYESILHLQAGTEEILQFTALSGSTKPNFAKNDIRALVQEVCDTQHLVAQQKNVRLILRDEWPKKVLLTCDANGMKRALHNVVSNAIKYTRDNSQVEIGYQKTAKQHCIFVSDHGIGIPQNEQKKVFGGFYRASNAKASGVGGTGLGLYLTQAIIAQHKGKITVESQEGKGTTFSMFLPDK